MTGLRTGKSSRNSNAWSAEPAGVVLPQCQRSALHPEMGLFRQSVTQLFLLRNKQSGLLVASLCRYQHDRKASRKKTKLSFIRKTRENSLQKKKRLISNALYQLSYLARKYACSSEFLGIWAIGEQQKVMGITFNVAFHHEQSLDF